MSNYRWQVPGSWTSNQIHSQEYKKRHMKDMLEWYIAANKDTMRRYEHIFKSQMETGLTWLCRKKYISMEEAFAYLKCFLDDTDD